MENQTSRNKTPHPQQREDQYRTLLMAIRGQAVMFIGFATVLLFDPFGIRTELQLFEADEQIRDIFGWAMMISGLVEGLFAGRFVEHIAAQSKK